MTSRTRDTSLAKLALGSGALALVVLIAGAALMMVAGMVADSASLIYLGAAFLASAIPLMAGVARGKDFDPFEPINLIAFAIFFGTTVRAPYLIFSDSARADFLMMGTTFEAVSRNAPAILLSIFALTLGYVIARNLRVPLENFAWVRDYRFDRKRLWLTIWLFVALSLLGTYLFMQSFNITLSEGLLSQSMKRFQAIPGDDGSEVYGVGYERFLAAMGQHAFILVSGLVLIGAVRFRDHPVPILILAFVSVFIPFLASSRATLFILFVNICVIAFYYGKLKLWRLILLAIVAAQMFVFLGALRESNQIRRDLAEVDTSVIDRVIGSGNSLDFVRTSAIIDRVPEVVGFQYGRTYAALVSAYVPRSMWPEKPPVTLGLFVKNEIFGVRARATGWPSGMVAEGWLNFGFMGLLIPLFLFGVMLRFIYESVRPLLGVSFAVTALYGTSAWRLGINAIGGNFAHGMTQTIAYFGPMLVILLLARKRGPAFAQARIPVMR